MRIVVIIIQAFFALSAIPCGLFLMVAPDGHLLQLPLQVLTNAPFRDFFWPGAILLGLLGLGHMIALVLAVRRTDLAQRAAQVMGLGAIIWIVVQVIMTDPFHTWQLIIDGLGLVELLGSRTV